MDDVIERFFQVKRAKGVSPRTEVSYREALGQFLGHYLSSDPTRTLQDVRSDDIVGFLVHLRDLGRGELRRCLLCGRPGRPALLALSESKNSRSVGRERHRSFIPTPSCHPVPPTQPTCATGAASGGLRQVGH